MFIPNSKVEGKNLNDTPDSDGVYYTRQLIELGKGGGGFVAYRFPRPGSEEPVAKVSYSTLFKPYGWVIASGIYIDDVAAIFWQQVWRIGALVAVALLLVVGMSFLLGRSIVNPILGMTVAMRKDCGRRHLHRSARRGIAATKSAAWRSRYRSSRTT